MADDQDESPLISTARQVYKGANDLINKIPSFGVSVEHKQPSPEVQELNKQMNDKSVQDANKTYVHSAQTAAQKKSVAPAPTGKTMIKPAQRKR